MTSNDIYQKIDGSWSHFDAYRHWCYESIAYVLGMALAQKAEALNVIEFGSLEPTTPIIRMLKKWGKDFEIDVKARVGRPFPQDDLTEPLDYPHASFDVVIADQVLEHVTDIKEAVFNLEELVRPGGFLILAMPFLYPIHDCPIDVTRLTPHGMKLLLTDRERADKTFEWVNDYRWEILECRSWGGKEVYRWWLDHLFSWVTIQQAKAECPGFNDPDYDSTFPMIVWMVARKK